MKGGTQPRGYTIVEVMIFLAISSLMFIVAAAAISGKQAIVEFKQGMSDINTQIRTVVNEVANGQFPSSANFKCSVSGGSPPVLVAGSTSQGTNGGTTTGGTSGCVFLGKIMQFGTSGPTAYDTYTVVGRQIDNATGNAVTAFAQAQPIVAQTAAVNLTTPGTLHNGLALKSALECNIDAAGLSTGCAPIGALGFFGSFGSPNATVPGDLQSGAQSVVTIAFQSVPTTVSSLNNELLIIDNPPLNAKRYVGLGKDVVLCFVNGSQKGSVTIGGSNGQQFSTSIATGAGVPAAC